jgi:uncharacterized membrane protein
MAQATEKIKDKISQTGSEDGSLLGGIASKGKLMPALATAAAAAAAGLAATKGPDILKKLTGEANNEAEDLGGKAVEGAKQAMSSRGGLMGKAASKLMGGDGDEGGGGGKKTRRLPIQRWVDVAVPVDKAYEAWTTFEEYPEFMHRVLDVKQEGDDKVHWREKIWFSSREWDGEITERRENERVAWKTVSGTQHSGIVSFHAIGDNLTRVMVTVDFVPQGMVEKMASGLRFVKRAVQADLARFKAYVEMEEVEGLEYKSKPAEMEQHREGDDDEHEDESDTQEAQNQGSDDSGDDEQRSAGREERESRREERRKALSAG